MAEVSINKKRIVKNTIFLYARMVFVMFVTLFTTRELLSALGVDDFGVYNVVCGFVSMFSFLNTSMANGTQRFYNYSLGESGDIKIAQIFTHSLIIQVSISILIVILVETVGIWYLNNKMVIPDGRYTAAHWIFQFSLIQLLLVMISVPYSAAVMAYEYMDFYAAVGIIDALLKLGIVYLLRYSNIDRLVFYGALMCSISLLNFLLYYVFCKIRIITIRIIKEWDGSLFSKMLSFSGWNIFGSVAHMMQNQGVNLILNSFWGTLINAANGVAGQISAAVNSLTSGFVTAVRPQMIKSYASGETESLKRMYYSVSKLTFYMVMILTVPLIGEVQCVLDLWLGNNKYPPITVVITQLTMIMALCNSYATPSSIIVHATGKMRTFQIVVSFVILMVIPLSYVAARCGCEPPMVILISVIVTLFAQLARVIIIRRLMDYQIRDYLANVIVPTLVVFVICMGFAKLVHCSLPNTITLSLVKIFINGLIALAVIYMFGINRSERHLVKSVLKR